MALSVIVFLCIACYSPLDYQMAEVDSAIPAVEAATGVNLRVTYSTNPNDVFDGDPLKLYLTQNLCEKVKKQPPNLTAGEFNRSE